jgi:hypothetical protein
MKLNPYIVQLGLIIKQAFDIEICKRRKSPEIWIYSHKSCQFWPAVWWVKAIFRIKIRALLRVRTGNTMISPTW